MGPAFATVYERLQFTAIRGPAGWHAAGIWRFSMNQGTDRWCDNQAVCHLSVDKGWRTCASDGQLQARGGAIAEKVQEAPFNLTHIA